MDKSIHQRIDKEIQRGYALIMEGRQLEGSDRWLGAWEDIKNILKETGTDNIFELDSKFNWTQSFDNFLQDFETELRNAGIDDSSYQQKFIDAAQELLPYVSVDQATTEILRRAIAETYAELGDLQTCDRLFEEWLNEDPNWGWGYIGWSSCYHFLAQGNRDLEKAEKILLGALGQKDLCDRTDVLERLALINEEKNNPEETAPNKTQTKKEHLDTSASSPFFAQEPAKPEKIGRNDPCPCGSGKKYKKCHGASQR